MNHYDAKTLLDSQYAALEALERAQTEAARAVRAREALLPALVSTTEAMLAGLRAEMKEADSSFKPVQRYAVRLTKPPAGDWPDWSLMHPDTKA